MTKSAVEIREIPLEHIVANPEQPRRDFNLEKLTELAGSIKEKGLVTPITVEATDKPNRFILEDGERRLRAHRMAGIKTILAVVKPSLNGSGKEGRLSNALVANLQRADMNPVEEGVAYRRLRDEFDWKISKIALATGLSAARINNRLLIAELDPEIQKLIINKRISKDTRALEALFSIPDQVARIKLAQQMAARSATTNTIVKTCAKLCEKLAAGVEIKSDLPPSIFHAEARAGKRNAPIWDQLRERKVLPSWDIVKDAAKKACAVCPWSENPTPDVCGQCPAVDLITFMVKKTHE